MKETRLTFESENLVVDYISFNIQGLVARKQVQRIAKYFFQILGFNSTFAKGSTGKEEDLFFDFRNQHQVSFRYYLYASEYNTPAKMQLKFILLLNNKSSIGIFLI